MNFRALSAWLAVLSPLCALPIAAQAQSPVVEPPPWAYPMAPQTQSTPDDPALRRVPGSDAAYTMKQIRDRFAAVDWHPEDHPVMPEVVARGRKPDVLACGFCHRADGSGGPEVRRMLASRDFPSNTLCAS